MWPFFTSHPGLSGNSRLPYKFMGISHEFIRQKGIPAHPWFMVSYLSIFFVIVVQTLHWVYTFLMAGTLCLCLFSSHALNWCINMMTNLASNRKSTGKWKIDNWQCWEFILQGGKEKIKPDTQIPAGACRQSQGGSALPSLSSKPEI